MKVEEWHGDIFLSKKTKLSFWFQAFQCICATTISTQIYLLHLLSTRGQITPISRPLNTPVRRGRKRAIGLFQR